MRVFAINGVAAGYEKLSTIEAAIGFTSAKIAPTTGSFAGKQARAALISVETADILFTMDGTTPAIAASVGHTLAKDQSYVIAGEANVSNFKCINAVDKNGAVVKCTFFY